MKKRISILISLAIITFIFLGSNIKSPSNSVENYFQNIKNGTSNPNTISLFSSIDSLNSNSDTKKVTDSLINSLSKLDIKVFDESLNGDTAIVTVQAKGLSLYTILNKIYNSLNSEELSDKINDMEEDELESYFASLLLEAINTAEIEERTINLNLTKVNKNWQIDDNDETLLEVLWGINEEKLTEMGI